MRNKYSRGKRNVIPAQQRMYLRSTPSKADVEASVNGLKLCRDALEKVKRNKKS